MRTLLKSDVLQVRKHLFDWGARTHVMGILNITEDSFAGDGLLERGIDLKQTALDQARRFLAAGADILAVAEKEDVTLIMLATRGEGMVKEFLLGSTANEVTRQSKRPVLIFPELLS